MLSRLVPVTRSSSRILASKTTRHRVLSVTSKPTKTTLLLRRPSHIPLTPRFHSSTPMAAPTDTQAEAVQSTTGITPESLAQTLREQLEATHVQIEDISGSFLFKLLHRDSLSSPLLSLIVHLLTEHCPYIDRRLRRFLYSPHRLPTIPGQDTAGPRPAREQYAKARDRCHSRLDAAMFDTGAMGEGERAECLRGAWRIGGGKR